MEEVSKAFRKALETMCTVQGGGNVHILVDMAKQCLQNEEQIEDRQELTKTGKSVENPLETSIPNCYNYFPLRNLLAQLECVLQIAQCILRVERVCSIHKSKDSK